MSHDASYTPELKSDDDWKQRVKDEDSRHDAQRQAESRPSGEATSRQLPDDIDASQLPPADFASLAQMLSTQAMVSLGLLPDPSTGKPQTRLGLARHFVDLLGVLEEKTKGNLSPAEQTLLDTSLHQLRMAYVELSRAAS